MSDKEVLLYGKRWRADKVIFISYGVYEYLSTSSLIYVDVQLAKPVYCDWSEFVELTYSFRETMEGDEYVNVLFKE